MKTGVRQVSPRSQSNHGLLLALCVALGGCSLSAPEKSELFVPSEPEDDAGGFDAAQLQGGDAGDGGTQEAGGGAGDAGDGGPQVFNPDQGLVLHYRFNETSGNTVNDFAGDKDALIAGTPVGFQQWVSPGHSGGALKLSGIAPDGGVGHSVELPQGALLGLQGCTISLWLNRAGGPMWQRVFDFGSGPPVWLYFTALGGTGLPVVAGRTPALIFVDFVTIADAPSGEGLLRINRPVPVGTWVHVAITWTANEIKVYMDGALVAQAVPNGRVAPTDLGNTSQNYIGRSQFAADPYFDGMVDDFRIYDRVLSASDVAALHQLQ